MHSGAISWATGVRFLRLLCHRTYPRYTLAMSRCFAASTESVDTIIRKFRSPSHDEEVTYEDLLDVLERISMYPRKADLAESMLHRFRSISVNISIQECFSFIQRMHNIQPLRKYPRVSGELRDAASFLASRGASSFSLDQFADYLEFCHRVRAHIDPVFLQNMCERIAAVEFTDSVEDQLELCKYILRVNKTLDDPLLCRRLQNIGGPALEQLSLTNMQDILTQLSGDSEAQEFIAIVRKSAMGALKSREIVHILEQLSSPTLSSAHDIFKASLAVCESRLDPESLSSVESSLLLRAWGRQRSVSSKFIETNLLKSIITKAFAEENELVANLHSLSRLTDLEFPQNPIVDAIIAKQDIDKDNLVSVVESVSLLRLHSPELVGVIMSNIDSYLCEVKDSSHLWKFAVWWQSLRNCLPYNSLLVDVLKKEYPETVRLLAACPSDEFIQQVRPKTWYAKTIESVATHLRNNRMNFTTLPRMEYTPLRAHFRVILDDSVCYVFLLKGEQNLQQVSSDSRLSIELIREFAHANKHTIAFIPSEDLMDPSLFNPREIIMNRLDKDS